MRGLRRWLQTWGRHPLATWQMKRAVRWASQYTSPSVATYHAMREHDPVTKALEALANRPAVVIDDHTGFDGMTHDEKAVWLTAYQAWLAGKGPSDAELLNMSTEDFQRFIQAKRDASFVPAIPGWRDTPPVRHTVQFNATPAYEQGLSPDEWMRRHPGQGLVQLAGINLRTLGHAYLRMEAGEELTGYEKDLIAARPDLNLGLINRQLRAMGKPEVRARTPHIEIEGETT